MKLFFIRHGETAYNADGRISGQSDIPLNETGIAQAQAIKTALPPGAAVIYSSDLIRCKQTTDILNEEMRLPVVYDARLRERSAGSLQGKQWDAVDPDGEIKKMNLQLQYDLRPFGGESVEEVQARVASCISDIQKREQGKTVLIVTSAGIIRLLHHLVHNEIHEKVHNSSIHEFDFE